MTMTTDHPDFIGFHCQNRPRNEKYDGVILAKYARDYFMEILDALPVSLRDIAMERGLLYSEAAEDPYSDEFDEWAREVEEFLSEHNIRWIFVSDNRPLEQFGEYCYCVFLPHDAILHEIPDPGVNDTASVYVYEADKVTPTCVDVEDCENDD